MNTTYTKYFYAIIALLTIENSIHAMDALEAKIIGCALDHGKTPEANARNLNTLTGYAAVGSTVAGRMLGLEDTMVSSLPEIINGLKDARERAFAIDPKLCRDAYNFSTINNKFIDAIRNLPENGGPSDEDRKRLAAHDKYLATVTVVHPDGSASKGIKATALEPYIRDAMMVVNMLRLSNPGLSVRDIIGSNSSTRPGASSNASSGGSSGGSNNRSSDRERDSGDGGRQDYIGRSNASTAGLNRAGVDRSRASEGGSIRVAGHTSRDCGVTVACDHGNRGDNLSGGTGIGDR